MMSPAEIQSAAQRLEQAELMRKQIGLLSLDYPEMSMSDAYAVQAALVKRKINAGRAIIGRKIGLTSKAMQSALNIDVPDSGILFDDMLFANHAIVPPDRFIQPRIEAELAFVMKRGLKGPGMTREQVLAATGYVSPAIEILDTRILRVDPLTKKTRNVFDTIADNAANAGIILGKQRINPADTDLRWIGAIVMCNDLVEETGLGAGVLNDPVTAVAWLADRLAEHGDEIRAGEIVLAGSFIRPVECNHGDRIVADFGPQGVVTCRFE